MNRKLGITIVIITHEMDVIKEICNRVAVMEDGEVVELSDVVKVFSNPEAQITKEFISSTSSLSRIDELLEEKASIVELDQGQQIWRLDFFGEKTEEAIIADVTKRFNIDPSIIFANVEVITNTVLGSLIIVLTISGDLEQEVLDYLASRKIKVEVIKRG